LKKRTKKLLLTWAEAGFTSTVQSNQKFFANFFQKNSPSLFSKLPIVLDPRAVSLAEGLRAGIAVAVTLIGGVMFNVPGLGLAALGALLTCFADPGGTIARRTPAVVSFALLSGVTYGIFGLLAGDGVWYAVPAAGLMIFATSYARVYGQGGLQVGNLLSVVTVLALGMPSETLDIALSRGGYFCAGAAWAALLTLVIWRVHPYAPARRALSDATRRLAALARELAVLAAGAGEQAAFAAHAAQHRRAVREAIETARGVALDTFRRRGLVTPRAAQLAVRLQTIEQIFGSLIALSDTLEHKAELRAPAAAPIRLVAGWLAALGPEIEANTELDTPKKQASLQRLRASLQALPDASVARKILLAISENLAVLITVSAPVGQSLSGGAPPPLGLRVSGPIRQNFNLGSAPMRHALRAATIATPTLAWTMLYGGQFAHWATITMVLCLQPYFSGTWVRSAERMAGTAVGGVVAAGIGLIAQTRFELAFIMLPLTGFAFTIRAVSYGAFIAALTPMIVLLIEQIAPGANELNVAFARVGYTVAGGCLAVFGNLLLWPGFEGGRLLPSMTAARTAHAAFVRATFAHVLDEAPPPDAARRAAGLASNNLEAALSRALLEPHAKGAPIIERGAIVDAALRRIAGRLTVLSLDPPRIEPADRALWTEWARWLDQALNGTMLPRPPLPAGAGQETLTRLARQVELLA